MSALAVLCTTPDIRSARRLAQALVRKKCAACVTILPRLESVYRWKTKVIKAREVLLVIKTASRSFSKAETVIRALHPYSVPEIIGLPVRCGSKEYLKWLNSSLH